MDRTGLLVCRLPSGKRVKRPMNGIDTDFDSSTDARKRAGDLGQVVHATETASGPSAHVTSAVLELGEALSGDRHADAYAGFAFLDLKVPELVESTQNALAEAEA